MSSVHRSFVSLVVSAGLVTGLGGCSLVWQPVVDPEPDAYFEEPDVYFADVPPEPDAGPDAFVVIPDEVCDGVGGDEDMDSLADCNDPDCFGDDSCCDPTVGTDYGATFSGMTLPPEWSDRDLARSYAGTALQVGVAQAPKQVLRPAATQRIAVGAPGADDHHQRHQTDQNGHDDDQPDHDQGRGGVQAEAEQRDAVRLRHDFGQRQAGGGDDQQKPAAREPNHQDRGGEQPMHRARGGGGNRKRAGLGRDGHHQAGNDQAIIEPDRLERHQLIDDEQAGGILTGGQRGAGGQDAGNRWGGPRNQVQGVETARQNGGAPAQKEGEPVAERQIAAD